jgi:hypothetical protein
MVRRRDVVVDVRVVFLVLGLGVVSLLTACNGGVTSQTSAKLLALLAIGQPSGAGAGTGQLVALRSDGEVDVIGVASKHIASVVATGADPQGGIAEAARSSSRPDSGRLLRTPSSRCWP